MLAVLTLPLDYIRRALFIQARSDQHTGHESVPEMVTRPIVQKPQAKRHIHPNPFPPVGFMLHARLQRI